MDTAHMLMLARLLSMAALIAATAEYAEVVRRRLASRAEARERAVLEQDGLHGLVRVFLADAGPQQTESFASLSR